MKEALKLALEAFDDRSSLMKWQMARDAVKEALREHAMYEVQRLGQEIQPEPPQRTWVGLTDDEIDQGLLRSDYAFKTAEAWRAGVVFAMTKLKEKNT